MGTIKVCIRVRPFIKEETSGERTGDGDLECCVDMPEKHCVRLFKNRDAGEMREFDFDRCYWSHSADHPLFADQEVVQEEVGKKMIQHALEGFNNCIFAYGQTGSGKSYSVLGGSGDQRGLLPRVVEGLFEDFAETDKEANMTRKNIVSFLEIYNDQIRDLLSAESHTKLDVKQHPELGIIVPGLTQAPVNACDEVLELIEFGTKMRTVAATAMNATSSRSHCVFSFKTTMVNDVTGEARASQTHLVDLAGSERAKRTKATGAELKRGAMINQSLSVLSRVIQTLAEKKGKNPPFRDCKLTYILKEALSGNSNTYMMAAISPSNWDYEETLSTLNFASSVKKVKTHAKTNTFNEKGMEQKLRNELDQLKSKLQELEMSKGEDARKLSVAQRKLRDQEELCRLFGGDWESTLKRERQNQQRRKFTIIDANHLESLQPLMQKHMLAMTETGNNVSEGGSSDSEDESSLSASSPGPRRQESLVLVSWGPSTSVPVTLEGPPAPAAAAVDAVPQQRQSTLVIRGPAVDNYLRDTMYDRPGAEARAQGLTKSLQQLLVDTARAEELVDKLSPAGAPRVKLRAMVAVDLRGVQAELLVLAGPAGFMAEGGVREEWLPVEDFRERLSRLEELAQRIPSDIALSAGGAWEAACAPLAPTRVGSGEEAEALRAQLAAVDAELSELRRQLQQAPAVAAPLMELRRPSVEKPTVAMLPGALQAQGGAAGGSKRLAKKAEGITAGGSKGLAKKVEASFADAMEALDAAQAAIEGLGRQPQPHADTWRAKEVSQTT